MDTTCAADPLPATFDELKSRTEEADKNRSFQCKTFSVQGASYSLVHRNIVTLALELFSDERFSDKYSSVFVPQYTPSGHRSYCHFFNGKWMEEQMKSIPVGAGLIAVILYADEKKLTKKNQRVVHPVYVTLGNFTREALRVLASKRVVAYLPVIEDPRVRRNPTRAANLSRTLWQLCFQQILEPLKQAQETLHIAKAPDGRYLDVMIRLSCICSDMPEGSKFTLVKKLPSVRPCHHCLCAYMNFCNYTLGKGATLRNQQIAKRLVGALGSRTPEAATARKRCQKISLFPIENCFWGLAGFDVYLGTPPDSLHTLDQGIFEWLLIFLYRWLDATYSDRRDEHKRLKAKIEERLVTMPRFPGLKVFPFGIERVVLEHEGRFQGTELRSVMKQIVVAIVDILSDPGPLRVFVSFLEVYQLAKKIPDERTLLHLERATEKFFEEIQFFKQYSPIRLNLPKLHALVHLPMFLRKFGHFDNFDAESFERFHGQAVTRAYAGTSRKAGVFVSQMACQAQQLERDTFLPPSTEPETNPLTAAIQPHPRLLGKGVKIDLEDLEPTLQRKILRNVAESSTPKILSFKSAKSKDHQFFAGIFGEEMRNSGVDVGTPAGNYYGSLQRLLQVNGQPFAAVRVFEEIKGSRQADLAALKCLKPTGRLRLEPLARLDSALHLVPFEGGYYLNRFVFMDRE